MTDLDYSVEIVLNLLTGRFCWVIFATFILIHFRSDPPSNEFVQYISDRVLPDVNTELSEKSEIEHRPTGPLDFILDYSVLEDPDPRPNEIGCQYTKECGDVIYEYKSFDSPEKGKQRVAVLISGSTPRVLIDRTLKQALIDANPKYRFELFIDLVHSSVRWKRYWFSDDISGVNFTSMFVRSFSVRTRPEYPTYWGPEIEISWDRKGGKRKWPYGNNSAHKFPDRGRHYSCDVLNMNKDPLVTKYRLAQTVKKFEKKLDFNYDLIFWVREDATFSNPLPLTFVKNEGLYVKRCMSWGGINDKVFLFNRKHLDVFENAVSIYYDEDFGESFDNNEKGQQLYWKKNKVKINRVKELFSLCDSLLWKGQLCYRFKYCPGCSFELEDREFTVNNCPAVLG